MDPWTILVSALTSGAVTAAILFGLKAYIGSYLTEKGKNLATKEDIKNFTDQVLQSEMAKIQAQTQSIEQLITNTKALTATTEPIRAKLTDETWDRQQRWTFKQQIYRELIEALNALYHAKMRHHALSLPGISDPKNLSEEITRVLSCMESFHSLVQVAAVVIDSASYEIVRKIAGSPDGDAGKLEAIGDALVCLAASARKDLGYPELTTEA